LNPSPFVGSLTLEEFIQTMRMGMHPNGASMRPRVVAAGKNAKPFDPRGVFRHVVFHFVISQGE